MADLSSFVRTIPAKMQEEDKRKHIVWSFWLILVALLFLPVAEAFIAVLMIGLAKECWDHFYGSGFCLFDILGNLLGSIIGTLLFLAISGLYRTVSTLP